MKEIKLDGWICRDGNRNQTLTLFTQYPERNKTKGYLKWWKRSESMTLPNELFPEIKWESEPLKISLTITYEK